MTDTKYLLAIDPGKSSGLALLSYGDHPVELVQAWQPEGGLGGLASWFSQHTEDSHFFVGWVLPELGEVGYFSDEAPLVICEKFVPLSGGGFSQTLDSTEPLRIEGALVWQGLMPDYSPGEKRWQRPNSMYRYGGSNLAEKKKRARAFLKANDLYTMPKDLGTKDSNDAMSATLHGVAYLLTTEKHKPTWDLVSNWAEEN